MSTTGYTYTPCVGILYFPRHRQHHYRLHIYSLCGNTLLPKARTTSLQVTHILPVWEYFTSQGTDNITTGYTYTPCVGILYFPRHGQHHYRLHVYSLCGNTLLPKARTTSLQVTHILPVWEYFTSQGTDNITTGYTYTPCVGILYFPRHGQHHYRLHVYSLCGNTLLPKARTTSLQVTHILPVWEYFTSQGTDTITTGYTYTPCVGILYFPRHGQHHYRLHVYSLCGNTLLPKARTTSLQVTRILPVWEYFTSQGTDNITTGYTYTPCVGILYFPMHGHHHYRLHIYSLCGNTLLPKARTTSLQVTHILPVWEYFTSQGTDTITTGYTYTPCVGILYFPRHGQHHYRLHIYSLCGNTLLPKARTTSLQVTHILPVWEYFTSQGTDTITTGYTYTPCVGILYFPRHGQHHYRLHIYSLCGNTLLPNARTPSLQVTHILPVWEYFTSKGTDNITTGYTYTPCVGILYFPRHGHQV